MRKKGHVNIDKDGGLHHISYKYQTIKIYQTESQLKPARGNTNQRNR